MSIKVEIPASLRRITQGKSEVQGTGATLRELIHDVDRQYPDFQAGICDDDGKTRKFVAVFVNGRDARTLRQMDTVLCGNEEIVIITAIAGG